MRYRTLLGRDLALAAALGAVPSDFGAEFGGHHGSFGTDVSPYGDDYGDDYGTDDMAGDFGAPAQSAAIAQYNARRSVSQHRNRVLNPNAGSHIDVERYTLQLSETIVLGTATAAFTQLTNRPTTRFRPQVMTANAPAPGIAYFTGIQVSNVNTLVGTGGVDAFTFSALAWGRATDLPTLSPAIPVIVSGFTTTFIPPGYAAGNYLFSVSFIGPSALVAGG
jgi:hypothetical protein